MRLSACVTVRRPGPAVPARAERHQDDRIVPVARWPTGMTYYVLKPAHQLLDPQRHLPSCVRTRSTRPSPASRLRVRLLHGLGQRRQLRNCSMNVNAASDWDTGRAAASASSPHTPRCEARHGHGGAVGGASGGNYCQCGPAEPSLTPSRSMRRLLQLRHARQRPGQDVRGLRVP